jgi:hypothetical protein
VFPSERRKWVEPKISFSTCRHLAMPWSLAPYRQCYSFTKEFLPHPGLVVALQPVLVGRPLRWLRRPRGAQGDYQRHFFLTARPFRHRGSFWRSIQLMVCIAVLGMGQQAALAQKNEDQERQSQRRSSSRSMRAAWLFGWAPTVRLRWTAANANDASLVSIRGSTSTGIQTAKDEALALARATAARSPVYSLKKFISTLFCNNIL